MLHEGLDVVIGAGFGVEAGDDFVQQGRNYEPGNKYLAGSTLAAIEFSASESGAWIPLVSQAENAGPTHTSTTRTTATPLEFSLPGAVADTPAPSGLTSAPVPSPFFSTARVTGIPTPTTTVAVPTPTTTAAVPRPTTGASESNAGYSALIGVAVLAVVGILLLRARKRRRR